MIKTRVAQMNANETKLFKGQKSLFVKEGNKSEKLWNIWEATVTV